MWDVEGHEGWVDGSIQGYCRHYEGFRGKITSIDFACTADGALDTRYMLLSLAVAHHLCMHSRSMLYRLTSLLRKRSSWNIFVYGNTKNMH